MLRRVLWFDFLSTSEDVPQRLTRLCTLTLCLMGTIGCITFILSGAHRCTSAFSHFSGLNFSFFVYRGNTLRGRTLDVTNGLTLRMFRKMYLKQRYFSRTQPGQEVFLRNRHIQKGNIWQVTGRNWLSICLSQANVNQSDQQ